MITRVSNLRSASRDERTPAGDDRHARAADRLSNIRQGSHTQGP